MLIIRTAQDLTLALTSPLPRRVRHVLSLRADLIDIATFVVAAEGDDVSTIETAVGIPLVPNAIGNSSNDNEDFFPLFEWVLDHNGAFEAPIITSDDGTGFILLVPDCDLVPSTLTATLRRFSEPAQ